MATCQIHKKHDWIDCQNSALDSDPDGFCLLHSRDKDKDRAVFDTAVQDKLAKEDYDFRGVFFPGPASFTDHKFTKDADFSRATFSGAAEFIRTIFSGRTYFVGTTFSIAARFWGATFSGAARFSEASFSGPTHFWGATFSEKVNFTAVTFTGSADFVGTTFTRAAVFSTAKFSGGASFTKVTFSGEADFVRTTFYGVSSFYEATFCGRTNFSWATIKGRLIFHSLNTRRSDEPPLHYEGLFGHLELSREAVLCFKDLSLAYAKLKGNDLRRVEFHNVTWHRRRGRDQVYDEILLKSIKPEPSAEDYARVEELYRYLKLNYEGEGDQKKAGDFHYGEMEMHRKAGAGRRWASWYSIYWALSGYGERPVRALICLAGLILGLAALVFWLEPKIAGGRGGLRDALFYILAQATFQRPDWFKPETDWGKFIRIISPLLIPGQAALFLLALRNRLGRRR